MKNSKAIMRAEHATGPNFVSENAQSEDADILQRIHMLNALLDVLIGCWHRKTSFPLTARSTAGRVQTYVVCLDCGRQFSYDWQMMRVGKRVKSGPNFDGVTTAFADSASAPVEHITSTAHCLDQ